MTVLITSTSSFFVPLPIQIFPFWFRITSTLLTPSWRQRCKKYSPSLIMKPQHSTLPTTECLDGLTFFPICSWPGDMQHLFHKSEIGDTETFKFVVFAFGNKMSPHLLMNFLFIKYRQNPAKIFKCIFQIQWISHSIPEKKHLCYYFDVTQSKYLRLDGSPTRWILWYTFTYHDNFPNQHQRRYQWHGPVSLHPQHINHSGTNPHWDGTQKRIGNCMGVLPRALR